jgi:hypothetical protein
MFVSSVQLLDKCELLVHTNVLRLFVKFFVWLYVWLCVWLFVWLYVWQIESLVIL